MGKLYQKLEEYGKSDFYPYHMPGHKRNAYGNMPEAIFRADITEIDGFDNLHQPEEILLQLQKEAAQLYGAEESFYLINGSTAGILSAISAALPDGGHILMARNSHKSAYHAAYLKNLTISYLYSDILEEYDIYDAITPEQVKKALDEQDNIDAVFVVSPTYEGRIAKIGEIAEIVHAKGIPLIVDEAHGAHLGLAEDFPANSCQQGADLIIHSVHKTLPAMTQTALLHVNGTLINRERLKRFLHIYQSSSPSYILMASIDNALQCVREQKQLFRELRQNYLHLLEKLKNCKHFQFVPFQEGQQDVGKLVISSKAMGLSGQKIYDLLLERYQLQLEMAADSYCLAMFTIGDGPEAYERLRQALLELDNLTQTNQIRNGAIQAYPVRQLPLQGLPLKQAWDAPFEEIPLEKAVGRMAGEFVNLYPPGVPLLVPGEVLVQSVIEVILSDIRLGLTVQGIGEQAPHYIKVLREN